MKTAKKQPNKINIKTSDIDYYAHISKKTLFDKRLTNTEKVILMQMLSLSNFYVSLSATSKFLNISEDTLKRTFKSLKIKGYLDIKKEDNKYIYVFSQESKDIPSFNPKYIDRYTMKQLNALYNNAETPTQYKNLIKKYFDALKLTEELFNLQLEEIKNYKSKENEEEQSNEEEDYTLPF